MSPGVPSSSPIPVCGNAVADGRSVGVAEACLADWVSCALRVAVAALVVGGVVGATDVLVGAELVLVGADEVLVGANTTSGVFVGALVFVGSGVLVGRGVYVGTGVELGFWVAVDVGTKAV